MKKTMKGKLPGVVHGYLDRRMLEKKMTCGLIYVYVTTAYGAN